MRRVFAVLVLGLIGLVAPLAAAPAAHADTANDEAQFVAKINDLRASKGVGPLAVDGELTAVARSWAQSMADAGGISHNPNLKDAISANWSLLGENVGVGPSVDALFTAFVNSPHHYENLVDPRYQYVGVGVVWRGNTMYTSHEFMTLRGGSSPAPAPVTTVPRVVTTNAPRPAPRPTVTTTPKPAPPVVAPAPAPVAPPPPPPPPVVPERVRQAVLELQQWDVSPA